MSLKYALYQDKRKNGGKLWYARAVHTSTVDFNEVCQMVQANTSAKISDVRLVLTEYIEQMKFFLQKGYKVEWENIGTFYITGTSSPVIDLQKVNAKQMHDPRLAFVAKINRQDGNVTRTYTEGVKVEKAVGFTKKTPKQA